MNDLNLKTKESALFALNSLPDSRTNLQTNCIKEYFKQFEFFNDKNDEFVYKYAATAVLAVTEITGCDILRDNEEYDSWCILLHGFCENVFNGMVEHYQPGKVFGIISEDTNRCKYHKGNLRTLEKLCIFACIPAYNVDIIYSIQLKNSREILEENKIVAVTIEDNCGKDDLNKSGITLANATEEFLIKSLFDEKDTYNMESFYYHFLLTYKIFLPNIVNLCKFIENSLELNKSVEKIFQFVYHWVDFHFEDFETNLNLINFLNKFIDLFKKISSPVCHYDEMLLELCSVKASIIDFKLVFDSQNCKKDYKFLVDTNGNYKKLFILSSNTNLVDLKGFEIISINSINVMNMDFKSLLSIQYLNSSEMNLQIRYNFLDINKMQDEYWLIHSNEVPCQYDDKCCHSFSIYNISKEVKFKELSQKSLLQNKLMKLSIKRSLHFDNNLLNVEKTMNKRSDDNYYKYSKRLSHFNESLRLQSDQTVLIKIYMNDDVYELIPIKRTNTIEILINTCYTVFKNVLEIIYPHMKNETKSNSVSLVEMQDNTNVYETKYVSKSSSSEGQKYIILANIKLIKIHNDGKITQQILKNDIIDIHLLLKYNNRLYFEVYPTLTQNLISNFSINNIRFKSVISLSIYSQNFKVLAIILLLRQYELVKQIKSSYFIDEFTSCRKSRVVKNLKPNCVNSILANDSLNAWEKLLEFTDFEYYWTLNEILRNYTFLHRVRAIESLIKVAYVSFKILNYNTAFNIILALSNGIIEKLYAVWKRVSKKSKSLFHMLYRDLANISYSSTYYTILRDTEPGTAFVPIIPLYSKDFRVYKEIMPNIINNKLINFQKAKAIGDSLKLLIFSSRSKLNLEFICEKAQLSINYAYAFFQIYYKTNTISSNFEMPQLALNQSLRSRQNSLLCDTHLTMQINLKIRWTCLRDIEKCLHFLNSKIERDPRNIQNMLHKTKLKDISSLNTQSSNHSQISTQDVYKYSQCNFIKLTSRSYIPINKLGLFGSLHTCKLVNRISNSVNRIANPIRKSKTTQFHSFYVKTHKFLSTPSIPVFGFTDNDNIKNSLKAESVEINDVQSVYLPKFEEIKKF